MPCIENYSLYVMSGFYIDERAEDGTIVSSSIGEDLKNGNVWTRVVSGAFRSTNDIVCDEDCVTSLSHFFF